VEERYRLPLGSLTARIQREAGDEGRSGAIGMQFILLSLPETEFLTVLERAASGFLEASQVEVLFKAGEGALRWHGTPYRRVSGSYAFEWIGDPVQHALTVQPALIALAGARLDGARSEFEQALLKRRLGAAKDLEDAVDEAAKSVESVLQVLHDLHAVTRPRNQQITSLFESLASAQKLPGYLNHLVTAAAGPRNHMASYGQGANVRHVPEELADVSIAAAATAIMLLAHYLP